MNKKPRAHFWQKFPLNELTPTEWEALCDGCGKCCLIKLENEETEEIFYTKIACRLFDDNSCKCGNYHLRKTLVSNCLFLTSDTIEKSCHWMPETCAYRLIWEGKKLKSWHHLISGSKETVHQAGISVKNSTISEYDVHEDYWNKYIVYD